MIRIPLNQIPEDIEEDNEDRFDLNGGGGFNQSYFSRFQSTLSIDGLDEDGS
jgi:hypothetical protein